MLKSIEFDKKLKLIAPIIRPQAESKAGYCLIVNEFFLRKDNRQIFVQSVTMKTGRRIFAGDVFAISRLAEKAPLLAF